MWSAIDDNMLMTIKPTKSEDTTAVVVTFDLSVCPMMMEEMAHIPVSERKRAIISNENTGLPYAYEPAGTRTSRPPACLRACGVVWRHRGGKARASKDDRRKITGHATEKQTEKYDRDQRASTTWPARSRC
jgi:hypothetical protein